MDCEKKAKKRNIICHLPLHPLWKGQGEMHIRQTSHSSGAVGINAPGDGGVGDAAVGAVGALFFIPETVVELIFI